MNMIICVPRYYLIKLNVDFKIVLSFLLNRIRILQSATDSINDP